MTDEQEICNIEFEDDDGMGTFICDLPKGHKGLHETKSWHRKEEKPESKKWIGPLCNMKDINNMCSGRFPEVWNSRLSPNCENCPFKHDTTQAQNCKEFEEQNRQVK